MPLPHRCGTDARRAAVLASAARVGGLALNGIDFVEVLDRDAPSPALRQRLLHVHFLRPDGIGDLAALNFAITGDAQGEAIPVLSVSPVPGSDRALALVLARIGDHGRWRLAVRDPARSGPPAHFDPPLSEVEFGFKTDCAAPFDCAAPPACPAPAPPFPMPDALARDWESFRTLMLDRLAATVPAWRTRNPADLGVTLVELLADAADRLAYLQDAAATEAYLGTARRRTSVRRHARLTGYRPHEGTNARTVVVFEVSADIVPRDPAGAPLPALPRGTALLAGPARGPVLGEAEARPLLAAAPIVFETLEDVFALRAAANAMPFHLWGERGCCLPRGATRAHLVRTAPGFLPRAGDLLVLEEGPGENGTPADPSRRHPVRLVADARVLEDRVAGLAVLEIAWHAEDALPFAFRLDGGVARGNAVLADEGRSIAAGPEALDPPRPAGSRWRPALAEEVGLVVAEPFAPAIARLRAASSALRQDPARALPALSLLAAGEAWSPRPDLLEEDGFSPAFVVETEPGERPRLRFGDGTFGRRPPEGFAAVRWRRGGGSRGAIGADTLRHLVVPATALAAALKDDRRRGRNAFASDAAAEAAAAAIAADLAARVVAVRNPIPGLGANDPEPTLAAKLAAPHAFRTPARAVTPEDYAAAAERHAEVQRARAERRWMGSWHVILLAIDRTGRRPVDRAFRDALLGHLEPVRLAGHDLEIVPPRFVPIEIVLRVCVGSGFVARDVERALIDRFSAGIRRDGTRGFFHPDRFTFGTPVVLSAIVAEAMAVPGVRWVGLGPVGRDGAPAAGVFRRLREPATDHAEAGAIPIGPCEIAVLDNDPDRPQDGRIAFLMEGGL